jgi:hypothetical protein
MKQVVFASLLAVPFIGAANGEVTFHKEVLPILQRHCQTCHRPGQIAPMSFITFRALALGPRP